MPEVPQKGGLGFLDTATTTTAALRIFSGTQEFAGPLAQALLIGGVVLLLLLFAGVVFWRARRTRRDPPG